MHPRKRSAFVILLALLLLVGAAYAQEDASPEAPPASETPAAEETPALPQEVLPTEAPPDPTETPVGVPTEVPTEAALEPTEEPVGTEVPAEATEEPVSTEVPAEATEETVGTEVPAESTEMPAPLSAPPFFVVELGVNLSVAAGETLVIPVRVSDDQGIVRVAAIENSTTRGAVLVTSGEPTETSAPFITSVTVTYTAPLDFAGVDVIDLVAIDGEGQRASLPLRVVVMSGAVAPEATPETEIEPARVRRILNYNPMADDSSVEAMLVALNAIEIDRIAQIGALLVEMPVDFASTALALNRVQGSAAARQSGLSVVEENLTMFTGAVTPNDPGFASQWALKTNLGSMWVSTTAGAWEQNAARGSGVVVAVVDSGVDLNHPDLKPNLVPGWDFYNDDNLPQDDDGHGTHVAGIIGAVGFNNQGVIGVAYRAKIMPIKVCDPIFGCPWWYVAAGIVHAVDANAKVINLSLGSCSGPSTTVEGAVRYALSRNVVVVASAGNGAPDCVPSTLYNYPASYPGVISVAAHNSSATSGNVLGGYNTNDRITVSAPGIDIYSTYPVAFGSYATLNGTSMAAPQVAGLAALLISAKVATTPATVREALICGAWDIGAVGYDNVYGHGVVQADYSMNWRFNSANCKVSQPNDRIENATVVNRVPFNVVQPIHTRSATIELGETCGVVGTCTQTLWFRFRPTKTDYYQITTFGSTYDTVLTVFRGEPGITNIYYQASNTDFATRVQSLLLLSLQAGQTYYIQVGKEGATPVDDQIMTLDIRAAYSSLNQTIQENHASIAYVGSWVSKPLNKANGGRVMETTDTSALAIVSFRLSGMSFEFFRTLSPTQGQTRYELYTALGSGITSVPNRAALLTPNQVISPVGFTSSTAWATLIISRDGALAGPLDFDALRIPDTLTTLKPITGMIDDRAPANLSYTGTWTQAAVPGAFKNTITRTTTNGSYVQARVNGSRIVIYRSIGPSYGSMEIRYNNQLIATVSNNNASPVLNVPYYFESAAMSPFVDQRLLEVKLITVGGTLEIDAIAGLTPAPINAGQKVDNVAANIVYSGNWVRQTGKATAFNKTVSSGVTGATSYASFSFSGNSFCVGYLAQPSGGTVQAQIKFANGSLAAISFSTFSAVADVAMETCLKDVAPPMADGLHEVYLQPFAGLDLDYVRSERVLVVTPQRGQLQETDKSFTYNSSLWTRNTARSIGGYAPRGGASIFTVNSGPASDITFYTTGRAFVLYTATGPTMGAWQILVNDTVYPIVWNGTSTTTIGLTDFRYRPMAFVVTGLPAPFYVFTKITLRPVVGVGQQVHFDGIRAIP